MNTTERIVDMLRSRSEVGLKKYGVSIDRDDLNLEQWIQHAIEEMLDGAQYLMRIKDNIKECYECNEQVHELSPRSRCVKCEHRRAIFNEKENDKLRGQIK